MSKWQYTKGLHETGKGIYAWLQPDGGWGWSNAGLITDGDKGLRVTHHIWVSSKADWDEIGDTGKQHPEAFNG